MSTPVNIQIGYKNSAWFTANPTLVLLEGQHVHLSDGADEFIDAYAIGDGVTQLQNLPWKGLKPIIHSFTITGSTVTLSSTPTSMASYYLNGQKCRVGNGGIITSIVGTLITFDMDYTDSYFEAIY